jgi:hypothetical protein
MIVQKMPMAHHPNVGYPSWLTQRPVTDSVPGSSGLSVLIAT